MRDAITCVDGHGGMFTPAGDAVRQRSPAGAGAANRLYGNRPVHPARAGGRPDLRPVHHLLLREWVMYSGVGVGIPKGEFRIWQGDQPLATLSPLEALDLPAYPRVIHYTFPHRILRDEDFPRFAAAALRRARRS